MKIFVASHNAGKINEIKRILQSLNVEICTFSDIGLSSVQEPEEIGHTFRENAEIKALAGYNLTGLPTIADDSGLEIDALDGQPGVYSARYAGENVTEKQNMEKVLLNMRDVPKYKRTARQKCCICCVLSDKNKFFAEGVVEGSISMSPVGTNGFGYDCIFIFDGVHTFAEVPIEIKNKVSHRTKALREAFVKLEKYIG